ncbi:MAG: helix-turn-helix domain-containing protein [Saprospiraceae bacterium]|nr:helix-turn-helix domain-containing protein [Saprospiraceae bacterium]
MPEATHQSLRANIVREYISGKSLKDISLEQDVPYRTVRRLCKLYREGGLDNLVPRYCQCGKSKADRMYKVRRICCWLKRKHPKWGAPFIRTIMEERYPGPPLPCERTMQSWFQGASLDTGPVSLSLPRPEKTKPKVPHQKWELDAKENVVLGDGSPACYMTITDVASGAFLEGLVFPPLESEPGDAQGITGKAHQSFRALVHAVHNKCGQRQTTW